jgi:uncharacterized damage-inducible protein DinB
MIKPLQRKMNAAIKPIVSIYRVNSNLLINSFKDVSEELSLKRPNKKTNSMMFLLLHTIDARYYMMKQFGVKIKNPFGKYIDWANTIEDIIKYPKLKRVMADWKRLDKLFVDKCSRLSSKQLEAETDFEFPGGKKIFNMIVFLAEHEAYHVGQLAFIRKFFGMKAVTF